MPLVQSPSARGVHRPRRRGRAGMRPDNAHAHPLPQGEAGGERGIERGDRGGGHRRLVPQDDDLQPPDVHEHDVPDSRLRDHRPDVALRPPVRSGLRARGGLQVRGPLQEAGPTSPYHVQVSSHGVRDVSGDLGLLVAIEKAGNHQHMDQHRGRRGSEQDQPPGAQVHRRRD